MRCHWTTSLYIALPLLTKNIYLECRTSQVYSPANVVAFMQADLGIINIGINDWIGASHTATSTYRTRLITTANKIQSGGGDAMFLVPIETQQSRTVADAAEQRTYADVLFDLSATNYNAPILDIPTRWGGYGGGSANGYYSDDRHANTTGYLNIANGLAPLLQQ
jgi:lysophospholipase L1-like esterase